MNNLINITLNENQEPVVSGRQLHKALGVKTAYKDWFPRMTEYGFTDGEDFSSFLSKSTGGRPSQDHIIKLDMAKEIAMIQRTDKGKEVRQYFIQVEKDFNSPEKIMARALLMADKKINKLEAQMFQWLRSNGYLISRRGDSWNQPTQKSMQLGLFELKKTNINHADGHTTTNTTTKVTGKGQQYFINKFLNQERLTF